MKFVMTKVVVLINGEPKVWMYFFFW